MELYHKIFALGTTLFFGAIIFNQYTFRKVLEFGIKDQTALRDRNEVKGYYLKVPFSLNFSVYLFNVTNPMEVQNGGVPDLKQVGPFIYDEWKEKVDVVENNAEDSLTYSPYETYIFNPSYSAPLKEEDVVTVIHPLIVGIVNFVSRDSPALLPVVNKAINSLFKPSSIYLTVKVKDLLWDGVTINCTVKDFSAKAVCTQMKSQVNMLQEVSKNVFTFSVFGSRNATARKRFKVLRGIKKSRDLGRLIEFEGKKELDIWSGKRCNKLQGTDGLIFPPLMKKEEGIWSFSGDICRSIQAVYEESSTYKKVPVNIYYAYLGDQSSDPNMKCFCPTPKTCLKKGILDLNPCMGVPVVGTMPHFYDVDEQYLKAVKGLSPDKDLHLIRIRFEQNTGTPIEGKIRLQLNFFVKSVSKIDVMRHVPSLLHPLLWIEESVDLSEDFISKVTIIFLAEKLGNIGSYLSMAAGLGGIGYSAYLYNKSKNQASVTPLRDYKSKAKNIENNNVNSSPEKQIVKSKMNRESKTNINKSDTEVQKFTQPNITDIRDGYPPKSEEHEDIMKNENSHEHEFENINEINHPNVVNSRLEENITTQNRNVTNSPNKVSANSIEIQERSNLNSELKIPEIGNNRTKYISPHSKLSDNTNVSELVEQPNLNRREGEINGNNNREDSNNANIKETINENNNSNRKKIDEKSNKDNHNEGNSNNTTIIEGRDKINVNKRVKRNGTALKINEGRVFGSPNHHLNG